ncbi:MAG: translation initiation factor IF-2 [Lachnospiraceae bacterium]|nr:translation initiation factor IF-2 [Lachnospiraceae bacterium]
MAKIRVHELAKDLEKSNKDILDFLKNKGVEVKSHMSSLEDNQVDMIKKAFTKKEEQPKQEEKPKKKNIIRVFRSQNASGSIPERKPRRPEQHKRPEGQTKAEGEGKKPVESAAQTIEKEIKAAPVQLDRPPVHHVAGSAPAPQKPVQEERAKEEVPQTKTPQADHTQTERPQGQSRPQTDRPQGQSRPQTDRPQGQNRPQGQSRPQTDRPQGQNRPQGDRPQGQGRPYNNNGQNRTYNNNGQNRPQGDRPQGQGRPYNNNGQNRPQGDRPQGQNRPYNNNGQSRPYNNNGQSRPYNNNGQSRPYNNNGQNRPQGDRPQGQGRPYNNNGQSRPYNNNNNGQNRPYGQNNAQGGRTYGQGRPGERNQNRPAAAQTGDAPLVRKTSRDPRKDNKEREKVREEHKGGIRPNQGGNRPNQGRRQFNRIPRALEKPSPKAKVEEKKEVITEITLPEKITIRELADKMKMQPSVIVKQLFLEGILVTVNHEIDYEKAEEIALGYDIIAEPEVKVDVIEELLKEDDEDEKELTARPPVVCVMGHVDHGKTSLLDAIRDTHVTDREAGGITQHIGAYVVESGGQKITFLDTPGHEAFTAMRMRGANSTDIAILVVAADDGVMPQTIEAINHAKAAGIEIIVAINKIDKPSANIERVKQELSEHELISEDWGGSTIFCPVSAHTREGIDNLLEMILLTSEVAELKANPTRKARGLVIEAQLDKGKGPVATILVQKGTLHVGDFIACGACSGKVRAMMDDKGRRVKEAGPSTPVEILGLSDVPNAGEVLVATDSDKEAKEFAATFIREGKSKLLDDTKARMSLDDLFTQIKEGNLKELPIIVKADVQGSVEAVKQSLVKLSNEEVVVKVIHGGVGAVNESDVALASASNAIIIGFNVRPDATAKATAEQEGVDLRLYKVIYQAIEDVEAAMKGMLDAVYEEKVIGHAEIRQIFNASGIGNIAGSYILDGMFQRNCTVRVTREGNQLFEGSLASLKRFKDDVKEVKAGFECGLVFDGWDAFQEFDQVEAYIMVEVPR